MILIYRTRNRHHISFSKVMRSECGRFLSSLQAVRVIPGEEIKKSEYLSLHQLLPFCKTCIGSTAWRAKDWKSEDADWMTLVNRRKKR